ncbi:MAG TPA: ThaI family type II restriction endonuclease [Candidatus Wujingus californicus]|uniref:ThaI family type II restriction endonuclease n=1 Tax=Candidatus Wujingus californicus TaxID=3367618 RepID=UPI002713DDFB|nr:ThaI family type II restriction endonuclease [Candidatus Brocadiales bacterium]
MNSKVIEIFEDKILRERIKNKLPHLFSIAELESSRAGKIGMEVGSTREKILIALLIYKFGERNVESQIPITEPEVDVRLFGHPVSIKTITGSGGVKVIWTVDAPKALEFFESYTPTCEILMAQIKWDLKEEDIKKSIHPGGLFLIPVSVQKKIMSQIGKEKYLKLPKVGTNPRGVEISKEGLLMLLQDKDTKCIEIVWRHSKIDYNPYKRWVDYWKE